MYRNLNYEIIINMFILYNCDDSLLLFFTIAYHTFKMQLECIFPPLVKNLLGEIKTMMKILLEKCLKRSALQRAKWLIHICGMND